MIFLELDVARLGSKAHSDPLFWLTRFQQMIVADRDFFGPAVDIDGDPFIGSTVDNVIVLDEIAMWPEIFASGVISE